jgi:hypothetical protein
VINSAMAYVTLDITSEKEKTILTNAKMVRETLLNTVTREVKTITENREIRLNSEYSRYN